MFFVLFCFVFVFVFNFHEFISVHSLKVANVGKLPYGVLGTALKFCLSEEIEFVPLFTSSKQRRKNVFFFTVVFVQFVKKSALDLENLPSSLLPGFIDVRKRLGIRTRF